jgi:hypothetical protein
VVGLPKGTTYELTVYPPVALGYLGTLKHLADSEGLRPIPVDVELRRGVQVRCRLLDKVTRQPVRGVLHYTPLKTNPFYSEAERDVGLVPTREFERVHVPDAAGVFHLVVYPGPGLLIPNLQGNARGYQTAHVTAAERARAEGDPHLGFASHAAAYRLLDPKGTEQSLTFDIELEPVVKSKQAEGSRQGRRQ